MYKYYKLRWIYVPHIQRNAVHRTIVFLPFQKTYENQETNISFFRKKYIEFKNSRFKRFSEYSLNYMLRSYMTRTTITPFSNITEQRGKDVNSSLNSLFGIFWRWSFTWSHPGCMGTVYTDRFIANEDIPRNIIQKHWTGMTDVIKSVSLNPKTSSNPHLFNKNFLTS